MKLLQMKNPKAALIAGAMAALPAPAFAQDVVSGMIRGICGFLGPFVGSNSQALSLIFLISLGAVIILWYLNDNKESMISYILRTAIALAILINIFTLPQLIGLPAVC